MRGGHRELDPLEWKNMICDSSFPAPRPGFVFCVLQLDCPECILAADFMSTSNSSGLIIKQNKLTLWNLCIKNLVRWTSCHYIAFAFPRGIDAASAFHIKDKGRERDPLSSILAFFRGLVERRRLEIDRGRTGTARAKAVP
jgi:hypothetical protein